MTSWNFAWDVFVAELMISAVFVVPLLVVSGVVLLVTRLRRRKSK